MTPAELEAIEARARNASPAPWSNNLGCRILDGTESVVLVHEGGYHLEPRPIPTGADLKFIAAARADVPALVAEVKRLTDDNERLRTCVEFAEWSATNETPGGDAVCPWCGAENDSRARNATHLSDCQAFTPDGQVR